ncbi:MAG: hypothetical protein AVDCRST_MAG41-748, partial [uncultured Corynebacteriales bacterium]
VRPAMAPRTIDHRPGQPAAAEPGSARGVALHLPLRLPVHRRRLQRAQAVGARLGDRPGLPRLEGQVLRAAGGV